MNLKKQIAIYLTPLIIATIPVSAHARNEFVFNFFKTIFRTALVPIAVPYSGLTNLYEKTKEEGVTGFAENVGDVFGAVIPKMAEEVTAPFRNEEMNLPVGDKGEFYRKIEEYSFLETLTEAILPTVTIGISPLIIPFNYAIKKISESRTESEQHQRYLEGILEKLTQTNGS